MTFTLTSPAFEQNEHIPEKFTCDGEQVSPELKISGVPEDAQSLALLMDDPDIPKELYPNGGTFDHWVVFNIPADTTDVAEGTAPPGTGGVNGRGKIGYTGPCPPTKYKPNEHRYFFRMYALGTKLELNEGATKDDVLTATAGHVLAVAELMGRYSREKVPSV